MYYSGTSSHQGPTGGADYRRPPAHSPGRPRTRSSSGVALAARVGHVVPVGYRPLVLVSDLRHFLDLPDDTPAPARRLAEQLQDIVRSATAREPGAGWVSGMPCLRRPGNRRCPGRILVRRTPPPAPITWACTTCGDAGSVSGWQDTPYDLSHVPTMSPGGAAKDIGITDDAAASLRKTMLLDADCEQVVYGARADRGQIVLTATDEQLEELLGYLAAEANHETNRRRRQRLDAAFDELSHGSRCPVEPAVASPDGAAAARGLPPAASASPTPASTGLPELEVARVQRWCAARVPERARHQVRVEGQPAMRHITIVERRAPWRDDTGPDWSSFPIARLRYAKTTRTWTLYWRDRNLRFHLYDRLPPSPHVDDLLTEIDRDPTCIFWG